MNEFFFGIFSMSAMDHRWTIAGHGWGPWDHHDYRWAPGNIMTNGELHWNLSIGSQPIFILLSLLQICYKLCRSETCKSIELVISYFTVPSFRDFFYYTIITLEIQVSLQIGTISSNWKNNFSFFQFPFASFVRSQA